MYRSHASKPYLVLALVEAAILLVSAYIGISVRLAAVDGAVAFGSFHFPQPLLFGLVILVIMFSLGLYNAHFASRMQDILVRLVHQADADTSAIRALNEKIQADERVTVSMLPLGDGLTMALKR